MKTKNFEVKWEHNQYYPSLSEKIRKRMAKTEGFRWIYKTWRERTICNIRNQNGTLVTQGEVKRYYKDQPNRRLGNKIAFKRAVDKILDKSLRTELWEGFKQLSIKCINC